MPYKAIERKQRNTFIYKKWADEALYTRILLLFQKYIFPNTEQKEISMFIDYAVNSDKKENILCKSYIQRECMEWLDICKLESIGRYPSKDYHFLKSLTGKRGVLCYAMILIGPLWPPLFLGGG